LISMRTMEAALMSQRCGVRAQQLGDELAAGYRSGSPVLFLAAKHDLPPQAVLKQILLENGHNESEVRAMIREPSTLPSDLVSQAGSIAEADLGSKLNADRIKQASEDFELRMGAFLDRSGVGFKTESELRRLETKAIPDFLLNEPVSIHGKPVRWIDVKNYPEYGSRLVTKSLIKQAKKYYGLFGPGAFVFSGGIKCGSLSVPHTIILDGSFI